MRIVFLQTEANIGGAEMCLLDLLSRLTAASGVEPRVVLGGEGPMVAALDALGVPCRVVPLPRSAATLGDAQPGGLRAAALSAAALAMPGYLMKLASALREPAADLVQTNGMKAHALAALACPRSTPLVWHMHDYISTRPLMQKILKAGLRRRGALGVTAVGVSHSVAADAAATLGAKARVVAIHNAVDLNRFHPAAARPELLDRNATTESGSARVAAPAPAPPGAVKVGLAATFAHWKGHDLFLDAVHALPVDLPARFYIVGGPIYRSAQSQVSFESLQARIAELGLADRVQLTGRADDPAGALAALDVVVHASTRPEPFGRVIVEGMACGRAVIAAIPGPGAPTSGAAELFTAEEHALAFPMGDSAALAEQIRRLVLDPGLRSRLAAAGLDHARRTFDVRSLDARWLPLYDELVPRHKPPRTTLSNTQPVAEARPA